MRRAAVLALVYLVVLAGCGSDGSGGGGTEPTVTPAAVPADTTTTTATDERERTLAPGVTTAGVVAPARLVGAHVDALAGRSFTTTRRAVSYTANGSLRSEVRTRGLVSADRRRLLVERRARGPVVRGIGLDGRTDQYIAGETVLQRERSGGTVTYDRTRRQPGTISGSVLVTDLTAGSTLALALDALTFEVRPYQDPWYSRQYRLVSTGVEDRDTLVGLGGRNVSDVSFMATVTDEGLVSWFRLSYTADRGDGQVRVVRTVGFDSLGETTVGRPSWYGNATRNLSATPDPTERPNTPVRTPLPPSTLGDGAVGRADYASGVRSTTVPS